jgi:TRAP-type C4-dicarboxylate transport system substrate-binding protein
MILGLVLVLALAVGLAACGEEEETTTTQATTATTAPPTTAATTATTEATTTTAAANAQEPIVFKMATTYQETETGGKIAQHFIDYVEDATGGVVTFELSPGGTLGSPPEMLGLVSSGAVDIIPFGHPAAGADLPLLNFPMWAPGSQQDAVDYFNHLVFENPETAPLIQEEATAHNIIYLGFNAGGSNYFISKTPFATLADLEGMKCGVGGMIPAFEAIGLEPVESFPPDTYENLSRGVIDCTQMAFAPSVQMSWYEVAPYYMFDGTYAAGNPWTVNLDSWAKLTPETQQIFMDAAAESETWSIQLVLEEEAAALETIIAAGTSEGDLTAEDQKMWWDALFAAAADSSWAGAVAGGYTDEMGAILAAAAEFTSTTWAPPAP